MPIEILAPAVANQIAAGEVVERPASAVKELIENSLDAGATDVRVEIREGGRRLIRVQDDGCGIPAAETGLLFQRHATSKIRSADDLDHLTTLGFRGEALASIASVAVVTLLTCARGETAGTLVRVEGGHEVSREGHGVPPGTTITIEHLFANVPARLKFLKQATTETGHILQIVTRYALAYPERRFSLVSDGKLSFQSTGSGKLYDVLVKVYGLETARQFVEVGRPGEGAEGRSHGDASQRGGGAEEPGRESSDVPFTEQTLAAAPGEEQGSGGKAASPPLLRSSAPPLRVTGYVGTPQLNRSNRGYITFFVNRRWFQDNSLAYGVIQAYHTLLQVGRYPVALIFIEMDPGEVDVNVHPTKAEVRFRDNRAVFGAVQRAVRTTLTENAPIPAVGLGHGPEAAPAEMPVQMSWDDAAAWTARRQALLGAGRGTGALDQAGYGRAGAQEQERALDAWATEEPAAGPPSPSAVPPVAASAAAQLMPLLRVVGQVAATYIVAEGPDGMYLIDQHAAHERILYEQMLAGHAAQTIPIQPLLAPLVVDLSPEQGAVFAANLDGLSELGVDVEPFGGDSYLLRALPAILSQDNPETALAEIVDGLMTNDDLVAGSREAQLITLICKRAAVKGGKVLSLTEMQELVRRLELCRSPRTCPHGRPTMVHVSAAELARQFGRI